MRSLCSRPLLHVHGFTPASPLLKPSAHLPLCTASHLPTPTRIARAAQIRNRHFIERLPCTAKSTSGGEIDGGEPSSDEKDDYVVVNFYRFVRIERPQDEVCKHLSFLQGRDVHGRIYLNEQGINAQYSGPQSDALAYIEWLKEDHRFSDVLVQISPSSCGHAFPRLKLRYKPSLVQLEGGISHLPLVDPEMRATPLSPSEWKRKLQTINGADKSTLENRTNKRCLLLDVRNGYEWDVGHFQGAERPDVDCFRTTSFGLSETESIDSDPLAGINKEETDILMYCTGGIRCDVYSTMLRQKGFQNLYTLSGGISNYLQKEGPAGWTGNLFVFDSRLSLPPTAYNPNATPEESKVCAASDETTFATCRICGSHLNEFRHRNCANIDCNLLFLSCSSCVEVYSGCCSSDCMSAPRLRPVLPGHKRYEKWHIYRDRELQKITNLLFPKHIYSSKWWLFP